MAVSETSDGSRRRGRRFVGPAVLVLVALLAAAAGGIFWSDLRAIWNTPHEVILKEKLVARWQALDLTKRTLDSASLPGGWDGGIFLGSSALNKAFDQLKGSKLEHSGEGPLKGTQVEIQSIDIKPSSGTLEGDVRLKVSRSDIYLDLWMSAAVMILGTEEGKDGEGNSLTTVIVRIEPLSFAPVVKIGPFHIGIRDFWGRLIPDLSVLLLSSDLFQVRIPLKDRHEFDTAVDYSDKDEVNDYKSTISYRIQIPSNKIEKHLAFTAPAYASGGVWIFGRMDDERPAFMRVADRPSGQNSDILGEVETLEKEIEAKLAKLATPESDIRLYIGKSLFLKLADEVAKLPQEKRVVVIGTTGAEGPLAKQDWSDKHLGRGGLAAGLAGNGSGATATIWIGEPKASWYGGQLSLDLPLRAVGSASIYVHVDPLLGGGASTYVGINGSGSGVVKATGKLGIAGSQDSTLALLDWDLSCEPVRLQVATDGKFKMDFAWTKVPSIGARVAIPPKPKTIRPVPLIDTRPIAVRVKDGRLKLADGTESNWIHHPSKLAVIIRLTPTVSNSEGDGFHIGASVSIDPVAMPEGDERLKDAAYDNLKRALTTEIEGVKKKTAAIIETLQRAENCVNRPEIAVLLGKIEFGSNNELLKFFRNAWKDIARGLGDKNELVRAYHSVTDAMIKANEAIDRPAQQAVEWMGQRADDVFGKNSEASKTFKEATKLVISPARIAPQGGSGGGVGAGTAIGGALGGPVGAAAGGIVDKALGGLKK